MISKRQSVMLTIATISAVSIIAMTQLAAASEDAESVSIVRDSQTILLQGKSLPTNDFLHLYDTTPYMIMNGHVAARVPCDAKFNSSVNILLGQAPDLKPAELELIKELSTSGKLCLYHADVESSDEQTITDIAIGNPNKKSVIFPAGSTIVIGINEIMAGAESPHDE